MELIILMVIVIVGIVVILGGAGIGQDLLLIHKKEDKIMASIKELQDKVDELVEVEKKREERDIAQDQVTKDQVALLQKTIEELQAVIVGGGLSPENQAIVDASVGKLQGTIDSLNAADPTSPITP